MNRMSFDKRKQVLNMLVEGSSMRSVSRVVGCSINTVSRLLVDAGRACIEYHNEHVRNVPSERIECDEIWSFCYAKRRTVERGGGLPADAGDLWTWTAIDADSKLLVSWLVGGRDGEFALAFMDDLQARLAGRIQLTTDGHGPYLEAVDEAFGGQIDYSMLIKQYGPDATIPETQRRYSPPKCVSVRRVPVQGRPDMERASTSYVERHNLTMRMSMRRLTRLTNAFSKKAENHAYALGLYFTFYNFCRPHMTLTRANRYSTTPAMAAGLTHRVYDVGWLVELVEARTPPPAKRGPYGRRKSAN